MTDKIIYLSGSKEFFSSRSQRPLSEFEKKRREKLAIRNAEDLAQIVKSITEKAKAAVEDKTDSNQQGLHAPIEELLKSKKSQEDLEYIYREMMTYFELIPQKEEEHKYLLEALNFFKEGLDKMSHSEDWKKDLKKLLAEINLKGNKTLFDLYNEKRSKFKPNDMKIDAALNLVLELAEKAIKNNPGRQKIVSRNLVSLQDFKNEKNRYNLFEQKLLAYIEKYQHKLNSENVKGNPIQILSSLSKAAKRDQAQRLSQELQSE
ncbi:MAG: hypothetical protein HRT47_04815 [Candidatus Caenarcaniphilales bacterium]|nr:hypothetical protein [Candidatus Caenarcaniphilales bacterium]